MLVILLALCFARGAVATTQDSLHVRLQSTDAEHIVVALQNTSDESVSILLWGSPFESELTQDLFSISVVNSAEKAVFRGRLIKRAYPLPEDFLSLAPGQTIEAIVPVVRWYDLPQFGDFQVELNWSAQYLNDSGELVSLTLTSAPLIATLLPQPGIRAALDPAFESCSADQQATIESAVSAAEQMAIVARDDLAALSEEERRYSPRYTQWFGAYDETRFDLVRATFNNLGDVLANQTLQFHCDCDDSKNIAYVFPAWPYKIYLCPAFWQVPLTGRNSKAGTILHELTHFPLVNGTSDHVDETATAKLAIEKPELAVKNADSYEYFAVNVPKLDIFNGVVFSELTLGNEVRAWLSQGQSSFYKVIGADYVELFSDTGNADILVFQSAATEIITCESRQVAGIDRCEVDQNRTVYIEITAVGEDANYRLVANTDPVVTVQTGDPGTNQPDEPVDPQQPVTPSDTDPAEPADDVKLGSSTTGTLLFLLLLYTTGFNNRRRTVR